MKLSLASLLYIFILVLVLPGCKNTTSQVAIAQIRPIIIRPEPLIIPEDSSNSAFGGLKRKKSVTRYYQLNGGKSIWIQDGQYTPLADSMIFMLEHVQYYGFPIGSYHLTELLDLAPNKSRDGLIRKDILLTDAFIAFAQNLKYGIGYSPGSEEDSVWVHVLNAALTGSGIKQTLEAQEPVLNGYTSLKNGLRVMLDSSKRTTVDSASLQQNIRLISINLERWRTEKENISGRYIFINIPSFQLEVVENDSVILTSKVIVGTPEKQTPVLSSRVECISIYPYWHVPRKIAVEEYLPIIKIDTTFLTRNNFDVLDRRGNILNPDSVEWNAFHEKYFPVSLRQREGPENSLGIIKFVFDNPHAVFLHDTNAKKLFKNKTRAFSHGCIRMEKAVELAHLLVTGVPGLESKYVRKFLKEKSQHRVDLANPTPIHIRYLTCEFKNKVFFRYDDVYNRDRELYQLIWHSEKALDL
ncbi:MAG: L,D-transpeptidase family protein [Bacteroidota bacterium]